MPYSLEPHTSFMELYVRVGSVKVTRQYSITSVSVTHTIQELMKKWHSSSSVNNAWKPNNLQFITQGLLLTF